MKSKLVVGGGVFLFTLWLFLFSFNSLASPLEIWHWRTQLQGESVYNLIYAQDKFVAAGAGGALLTSPDGENWTPQKSGTSLGLSGLTYGNGIFLATSVSGYPFDHASILTSSNGIDWSTTPTNLGIGSVVFGNGLFVGISSGYQGSSTICVSSNGLDWSVPVSHYEQRPDYSVPRRWDLTNYYFANIVFGNGTFVIIGTRVSGVYELLSMPSETFDNFVLTSTDGLTWVEHLLGDDLSDWYSYSTSITFGAGKFVANSRKLITSQDGINWKVIEPTSNEDQPRELLYAGGLFMGCDYYGAFFTSEDGSHWIRQELGPVWPRFFAAYGHGKFLAFSQDGVLLNSTNGTNWSRQQAASPDLLDITFTNEQFIAVGANGTIQTSTNAQDWVKQSSGLEDSTGTNFLRRIVYAQGKYVAVGNNSGTSNAIIVTSSNVLNWSSVEGVAARALEGIAHGNGRYVAVGCDSLLTNGVLLTSPDAKQWTAQNVNSCPALHAVAFGDGQFVAAGDKGTLLTSSNSLDWTPHPYITTYKIQSVAFANHRFVAGAEGDYPTILVSTNGLDWQSFSAPIKSLHQIVYAAGRFIAAGTNGLAASSDGAHWTPLQVPFTTFRGVAYGQGTFVAVGIGGAILQSDPWSSDLDFIQLGYPKALPDHLATLKVMAPTGLAFDLQTSDNLVDWTSVGAGVATFEATAFLDNSTMTYPHRYYRAVIRK